MRVPYSILRCVAFIGLPGNSRAAKSEYKATGFFLEVQSEFDPEVRFRYFVTAAHVARKIFDGRFVVRLNHALAYNTFEVNGEEMEWYFHPDKAIDIAVAHWFPDNEPVDHEPVPATMVLPEPLVQIGGRAGIGDEVFIVGLFTRFHGVVRNWPIVRIGNLAMAPNEKHKTKLGEASMYLVETRSIGGLSGSPVFIRETAYAPVPHPTGPPGVIAGGGPIFLLGVVHGHHDEKAKSDFGSSEIVNMGISEVTPADFILEVISTAPELVAMRKKHAEARSKEHTATMDFAASDTTTQKTRGGKEIPIPKRGDFLSDLTKATRRRKKPSA